jgi:hypothetical protein
MRRLIPLSIILAIAAFAVVGFAASLNVDSARLTVFSNTLSTTSLELTLSDPGPVESGTSVSADASLLGATSDASGTVYYNVYSDSSCGTLYSSAGSSSVTNGSVDSGSDSVTFYDAGSYYWQASYSGDGENRPSISTCGDTVLVVFESEPQEPSLLYLDMSSGELVTTVGSGTTTLYPDGGVATFRSDVEVEVGTGSGWQLSLRQTGPTPSFTSALVDVDVWVTDASCDGVPSTGDADYVAGTSSSYDITSKTVPKTVTISLTSNPNFEPSDKINLCLMVTNVDGNSGAPPHSIEISGDSDSYLSGPFTVD